MRKDNFWISRPQVSTNQLTTFSRRKKSKTKIKRNKHFAARKNVLANCYKIAVDFWHAKANILWKKNA
jgi:hypothetical protein